MFSANKTAMRRDPTVDNTVTNPFRIPNWQPVHYYRQNRSSDPSRSESVETHRAGFNEAVLNLTIFQDHMTVDTDLLTFDMVNHTQLNISFEGADWIPRDQFFHLHIYVDGTASQVTPLLMEGNFTVDGFGHRKQPLNPYIGVPGRGCQHELCYMFQRKGNDELRVWMPWVPRVPTFDYNCKFDSPESTIGTSGRVSPADRCLAVDEGKGNTCGTKSCFFKEKQFHEEDWKKYNWKDGKDGKEDEPPHCGCYINAGWTTDEMEASAQVGGREGEGYVGSVRVFVCVRERVR